MAKDKILVSIRATYTIATYYDGELTFANGKDSIPFTVLIGTENKIKVSIEFFNNKKIVAIQEKELTEKQLKYITDNNLPFNNDIEKYIKDDLDKAIIKFLELIKFFIRHTEIKEIPFFDKKYEYLREYNWIGIPNKNEPYFKWFGESISLEDKQISWLQIFLDSGIEPFMGLRFLHNAMNSQDEVKYRWINATIAAELCIKEFFVKYANTKGLKLDNFLLNIPSPSIEQMYGLILKDFTGEQSIKLNELEEGMKMRNKLVHRYLIDDNIIPTIQKCDLYIKNVEIAIYQLFALLYKDNGYIQRLYEEMKKGN